MRRLGELEAEIMDRLWRWERAVTVREIVDDINRTRPLAYTTVLTVADVLYRKGWLRRGKSGRAWTYEPVRSRADYTAGLMRDALGCASDRPAALMRFVEHMSPEDVGSLDAALRSLGRQAATDEGAAPGDGVRG
ncbi:BlaI/MecI/CopY family transcriptional regulator [Streptomyces sp. NPDC060031]|uniref:BlaI/MecI/CopY family transcriptional regulator n=1 Tax=Streptomyces sp. NPDC060031 TaxID=3347043 RepID=UPI00369AF2B0